MQSIQGSNFSFERSTECWAPRLTSNGPLKDDRLRGDFDVFDLARSSGNGQPVFAQTLDVEHDGLANLRFDFGHRRTRGNTAGKIRHVSRVVAFGLFNDDGVAHKTSRFQAGLLQDAVQRAGRQVIARLAGNGDTARLVRMLKLPMAPPSCNQHPAIGLEHSEDFAHLHEGRIAGSPAQGSFCEANP